MKPKFHRLFIALATAASLPFVPATATADTLTWDGGTNTNWDAFTDNWVGLATWNSVTPDDAVFGAVGVGAINISTGVAANALTFNTAGYNIGGASLTLSGNSLLTANADATISAQISGTNGIGKLGTGTVILTGANNYTGVSDILEGTLQLGDGITIPTVNSTYNISAGATLRIKYPASGAVAQTWSKFTGAGTLALGTEKFNDAGWGESVALPAGFTGTLKIEKGRVTPISLAAGLGGTTSVVINDGGHLGLYKAAGTYNQSFTIAGSGYGETNYEVAIRFPANTTLAGPITLTGNTALGGTGAVILSGGISETAPSGLSFGANQLSTGVYTLSGTNTYTGPTTLNFGTVRFAKQVSLYNNTPASWTADNLVIKAGLTAIFNVGGIGEFTPSDIATIAGLGSATGGFANNTNLQLDTANATAPFELSGNLANPNGGANMLNLNKIGAGTLTLSGTNTYTGKTTTTGGVLKFATPAALYNSDTTKWTLTNLNFQTGTIAAFAVGGPGEFTTANLDTLQLLGSTTGGFRSGSMLGIDTTNVPGGTLTYGTIIGVPGSQTRGIAKLGAGKLELTGASTYTGPTTISGGELAINGRGTGTPGVFTVAGGTLSIAATLPLAGNQFAVGTTAGAGIVNHASGTVSFTGGNAMIVGNGGTATYNLNGGTLSTAFTTASTTRGLTIGYGAGSTGSFNLNSGTLSLPNTTLQVGRSDAAASNTINQFNQSGGSATVNTLRIGGSGTTSTGVNSTLNLTNGTFAATTFTTLAAGNGDVVNLNIGGTATVTLPAFPTGRGSGATATLNFDGGTLKNSVASGTYMGNLTNAFIKAGGAKIDTTSGNATISQALLADPVSTGGGLTKLGTNTLTLGGANTYTGVTSINAGTLSLNASGSAPNTDVQVKNAATLQLESAGKALKSLTVDGGSTLALPVSASPTTVTDALTLNTTPNFTVRPVFFSAPQVGTYELLVPASVAGTAGTITTDFSSLGASRVAGNTTVTAGKLVLNITSPGADLVWNGPVGGNWNLNTDANFTGATPGTFQNLDSVTFGDTAAGTVTLVGTLNPAITKVDSSLAYTFGGTGTIAGTGSLIKTGSGSLTISTAHSYVGSTTINGGVLSIATVAANGINSPIGAGTALNLDGGILRYTGGSFGGDGGPKFDRMINVGTNGGAIDIAGTGIVFSSSPLTGNGKLSILDTSGDANNRQWLYSGNSPSFTGSIDIGNGTPNSGWVQYRSNAANPFGTAVITVNAGGVLSSDNGNASGSPASLANNIVLNGGTFSAQGVATIYGGSVLAATGTTSFLSLGTVNLVLAGSLSGDGTLQKSVGAGSVELRGNNAGFSGVYNHTADGGTIFYTADSASAAASWNIPSGSNASARFLAGGTDATYKLGSLAGTTGRLENLGAASGNSVFEIGALGTDTTFAGTIQNGVGGTVALTKVGAGKLTLTGTLAYSGATSVNAGTLQVNATNSATRSQTTTLANGTTLAVGGAAGTIWETQSLTLGTGGATTVSLLNLSMSATQARLGVIDTYTVNGPVTLNVGGVLAVGTVPLIKYPTGTTINLASYTLTGLPRGAAANLVNNTTDERIDLNVTGVNDLIWNGNLGPNWEVGGTNKNWVLAGTPETYLDGDRVLFDDTATGTSAIVLNELVSPAAVTFNNSSKAYSFTGAGGIAGSIGVNITNNGTVTFATDNTYTGATTVGAGAIFQLGDGTDNGIIMGALVSNGETIFNPATTQTFAGALSGGGTISKVGPGTQIWTTTSNAFSSTVKVDGGTLQIGTATNASLGSTTYDIADGARLFLNYATAVQSTSLAPWTAQVKGAGTLEITSAQAINGTANWGANTPTPAVNPFSAEFTGTFILGKGRFDSPASGLGGMTKMVVPNGGQFLSWSGTFPMALELAGLGWGEPGGTFGYPGALRTAAGGVAIFSGPITLTANSGILAQTDSIVTVTGSITGPYQLDLAVGSQFGNKGTLTVAPDSLDQNSYSSTRILGSGTDETGTVVAGNARAFSTGGLKVDSCILKLNGFNFTFANLSGAGGKIANYATDSSILTVGTDGTNTSCASVIADGGTGTLSLVKTGAGTLTLTGASTYTGATTINAGTLQINGANASSITNNANLAFGNAAALTFAGNITGTGSLTKTAAGALNLTGAYTYTGNTTVNGGTLTLNSATLADTSTVTIATGAKLDLNTSAAIDTIGSLVLGGVTVPAGTYGASHPIYGTYFSGTGSVVINGGYTSWAADVANGLTAGVNDGPSQDPDFDGVSNLLEYVLGGKPMQANPSILPQPTISGGFLVLSYKRSDESEADTTQTGRWSTDLADWTGTAITPELINENGASPDDMVIRIPLANALNGQLYGRLSVTK